MGSDFDNLRAQLAAFGVLKAWSVAFTCLVDTCLDTGGSLTGPQLAAITGRLGISATAQRTALHRLRNDGLIDIARKGRVSAVSLSAHGRAQALKVNDRIYAAHATPPKQAYLVATEPGKDLPPDAVAIAKGLGLAVRPGSPNVLSALVETELPHWAITALLPPGEAEHYARLAEVLTQTPPARLSIDDAHALRTLILHIWRRLHLRQPPLAAQFFESLGPGRTTRAHVARWLSALPRAAQAPRPASRI